jgi:broad specificity phosphatase PhoE
MAAAAPVCVWVLETAAILAHGRSLDVIPRDGLREIGHGHWEGLNRREVETRFPDEYSAWEADQAPACLNIVEFKDPVRARLMLFNDVSHYARETRRPETNLSSWWDPATR